MKHPSHPNNEGRFTRVSITPGYFDPIERPEARTNLASRICLVLAIVLLLAAAKLAS
jgi:hypothetical protein